MPGDPNTYVAIVDDDESVCRSLGRLLSASGFLPVTFSSAEDFLDDRKRPHFDCLVLDVQLDGISGIELARRLVAVNDQTPFIFITAHDDPAAEAEAIALGCAGYFRKHDAGNAIIHSIREAVCRKRSATV